MFKFPDDYLDSPSDIMGGFDRTAYIALAEWIVAWPELVPDGAADADIVTLVGNFVLAPDQYFIQISGRSGLDSEGQGDRDCRSVRNAGQLFRAGTHAENIALHRKLNGAYGVVIFTDGPNGADRTVVGDSIRPAWFTAKVAYGTNAPDSKGVTVNYDASGFVAGYKYNGVIPTREVHHDYAIAADPAAGTLSAVAGSYIDVRIVATVDGQPAAASYRTPPAWLGVEFVNTAPDGASIYRITALTDNLSETVRPGAVTFYPVGSAVTASVALTQDASEYAIDVDPVDVDFDAHGGTKEVTVNATRNGLPTAYTRKSSPAWIIAVPGTPATLTASAYGGMIPRTDKVVWQIPGASVTTVNNVTQMSVNIPVTYFGVVNTAYPTADDIKALPTIRSDNSDITRSFTTVNQWIIVAEPASFDPFVEVVDAYGFDKTNAFRTDLVDIAGAPYRFIITAPPLATTQSNAQFTFKK